MKSAESRRPRPRLMEIADRAEWCGRGEPCTRRSCLEPRVLDEFRFVLSGGCSCSASAMRQEGDRPAGLRSASDPGKRPGSEIWARVRASSFPLDRAVLLAPAPARRPHDGPSERRRGGRPTSGRASRNVSSVRRARRAWLPTVSEENSLPGSPPRATTLPYPGHRAATSWVATARRARAPADSSRWRMRCRPREKPADVSVVRIACRGRQLLRGRRSSRKPFAGAREVQALRRIGSVRQVALRSPCRSGWTPGRPARPARTTVRQLDDRLNATELVRVGQKRLPSSFRPRRTSLGSVPFANRARPETFHALALRNVKVAAASGSSSVGTVQPVIRTSHAVTWTTAPPGRTEHRAPFGATHNRGLNSSTPPDPERRRPRSPSPWTRDSSTGCMKEPRPELPNLNHERTPAFPIAAQNPTCPHRRRNIRLR